MLFRSSSIPTPPTTQLSPVPFRTGRPPIYPFAICVLVLTFEPGPGLNDPFKSGDDPVDSVPGLLEDLLSLAIDDDEDVTYDW